MGRYRGSDVMMWVDLAGAVGRPEVNCWKVVVGRLADTADLVQGLLRTERQVDG